MTKQEADKYMIDPDDGFPVEDVGEWASEKHERLRRYVNASSAARRKFRGDAAYIDLYCGPGRVRPRNLTSSVPGGAVLAYEESARRAPFTSAHIGDKNSNMVAACAARLSAIGCPSVKQYFGTAVETAVQVARNVSSAGLHLAFLDPYNLNSIPFSVIEALATNKRIDLLIHVSSMDLARNLRLYAKGDCIDQFAPGWREGFDLNQRDDIVRHHIFAHWKSLLQGLDYIVDGEELVSGNKNQPFYWLVLASRHPLGAKLWHEVRNVHPQRSFF